MSNVTFRDATPEDCQFAFDVKKASFREYVDLLMGWDEDDEWAFHQGRFASQPFQIVVFGGEEVGVMVVGHYDGYLHLHQLFLLPSAQSQGIGAECLRQVLAKADGLGYPVRLRVMKVNPRAKALYERFGFVVTEESETHHTMQYK